MRKNKAWWLAGVVLILVISLRWSVSAARSHDFHGECQRCHVNVPDKGQRTKKLVFVDEIDKLCARCHAIDKKRSHPIKIKPKKGVPLAFHLDKDGFLTCTTCHDIHKEDKSSNKVELTGLLWGHVRGRAFCVLCHDEASFNRDWKHQTAISSAHVFGVFKQQRFGNSLDLFSTECLSCHDNTVSRLPQVEVRGGVWEHGLGSSHPIGVEYPRSDNFVVRENLPAEIRLFDGKLGCLTCHEIYNSKTDKMLAMDNRKSRLCLSCHKK